MATQRTTICDVCKKPTEKIVGKLFYTPNDGRLSRSQSNYSHTADVGECCSAKLLRGFNFRKRLTAEEYNKARKAS